MSDVPMVCALMLTNNRPEMAKRAIACFRQQSYPAGRRILLIANSGGGPVLQNEGVNEREPCFIGLDALGSIGAIRNLAIKYVLAHYSVNGTRPEVIVHWDDDDWSCPERIARQVAALKIFGPSAACVGYRQGFFWDTRGSAGEAWSYKHPDGRYVLGSSMCYWADAWQGCKFDAAPHEDYRWWTRNASRCVGEIGGVNMIFSIHGSNTERYDPADRSRCTEWQRAEHLDADFERIMRL